MDNQLSDISSDILLSMKCGYEKDNSLPYSVYVNVVEELKRRSMISMGNNKYVRHTHRFLLYKEVVSNKLLNKCISNFNGTLVEFRPNTLEVSMHYTNGHLIRVVTKGNGVEGKDITSLVYNLLKGKGRRIPRLDETVIHGFIMNTNGTPIMTVEDIIYNQYDLLFYGYEMYFDGAPSDTFIRLTLLSAMVNYVNEILDMKIITKIYNRDKLSLYMNVMQHNSQYMYIVFDIIVRGISEHSTHGLYTNTNYDPNIMKVIN